MQRQLWNLLPDMGVPRQSEMDELRGRLDRLQRADRQWENSRRSAEVDWVGLAIAPHIPSIPNSQTILNKNFTKLTMLSSTG